MNVPTTPTGFSVLAGACWRGCAAAWLRLARIRKWIPNKSDASFARAAALALLVFVASCAWAPAVRADIAGYPSAITAADPREMAMLPEYCKYAQLFREKVPGGNNPAEIKRWLAIMGDMFHHIHHYCWGLMKTNRAMILARTKQDRTYYLSDSIGEFDYVIERATDDFVLLPEVLTRKGENLIRLGRNVEAVRELTRAIDLKRDYWPPYGVLAEHYKATGDIAKARDVLKQGLANAPNSPALRRQLSQLSAAETSDATDPPGIAGATR